MRMSIYSYTFDFDTFKNDIFKSVIFRYFQKWLFRSFWHFWIFFISTILRMTLSKMTFESVWIDRHPQIVSRIQGYICIYFLIKSYLLHILMLHTIVDDVVSCSFYINIFLPWCVERQDSMLYMQYVCYSPIECLLLFEVPIDSIFGVIRSTTLKGFGSIYFFAYCFYWTELEECLTRKKIKLEVWDGLDYNSIVFSVLFEFCVASQTVETPMGWFKNKLGL